jgi:hypothetical protein
LTLQRTRARPLPLALLPSSGWLVNGYGKSEAGYSTLSLFSACFYSVEKETMECKKNKQNNVDGDELEDGICSSDTLAAYEPFPTQYDLVKAGCQKLDAAAAFCVLTFVCSLMVVAVALVKGVFNKGGLCAGWMSLALATITFVVALISLATVGAAGHDMNALVEEAYSGMEVPDEMLLKVNAGFALELVGGVATLVGGIALKFATEAPAA